MVEKTVQARKPFTFCGSCWSDGSAGPVAISIPQGGISSHMLSELNTAYKGRVSWRTLGYIFALSFFVL